MKQQFLKILTAGTEDAILPFLRQLNEKERKSLIPVIRKESEQLYSYVETPANRYSRIGTPEQISILQISTYYCFDRKNIMPTRKWRFPSVTVINDLLADYIPEWLEDYFLQMELSDFHSGLRYPMLLEWIK